MTPTRTSRPLGERFPGRLRRVAAGSLAAAALVTLGAACGGDEQTSADETSASSVPADADFNEADVAFVAGMIPHHQQAVMMAEMVQGRDIDPAIADLAAQIRDAQQPEIEQMTGFLDEWGVEPTAGMGDMSDMGDMSGMDHDMNGMDHDMGGVEMEGMMSPQQMSDLRTASDAAFGDLWLELMVEHHRGAIEQSRTQIAEGEDAGAIELAREIARTQAAEIGTMQDLLAR
ncbi:DUF305 domain-containing protein [Nocardioidaceae bacterium]|nr:DUF305 domain-containing protein [Nocardioidaceae bacterium]